MTILQSLDRYYDRMAARGEAEAPGWSREKIGFAIVLSPEGEPSQVLDLRQQSGKKLQPQQIEVPAAVKRTAGILPNLLWDKSAYVLGRTAGEGKRTADEHAAFRKTNLDLLGEDASQDEGLRALRRFLETWQPGRFDATPFSADMLDANLVFALAGETRFLHERDAARALVAARLGGEGARAMCLVSGIEAPLRRLHPTIKGVEGAQSSGAALVSFNLDAFGSYGQEQGANAPTSEAAAFRYGAALNRMLDRGSRNRLPRPLGDATVVFWAEAPTPDPDGEKAAEAIDAAFNDMFSPPAAEAGTPDDAPATAELDRLLTVLREGRPLRDARPDLRDGVRFHILGLAPNAARLSVRFWLSDSFEVFARRLADHYTALEIEPRPWRAGPPSIGQLLVRTTALRGEFKNIPPALAGEVMRAILAGTPYPRTLLSAAIIRLRAGDGGGTGWHAAVIKAVINRSGQEKLPVALEPDHPNVAYQLGRLFAVIEDAQRTALGKVNAPIGDRYYGAASATPARVFPTLLRGARLHAADARKRGTGGWIEPKMEKIVARLPPDLPRILRLEDQGRFAVGYYHERASRPPKAADDSTRTDPNEGNTDGE